MRTYKSRTRAGHPVLKLSSKLAREELTCQSVEGGVVRRQGRGSLERGHWEAGYPGVRAPQPCQTWVSHSHRSVRGHTQHRGGAACERATVGREATQGAVGGVVVVASFLVALFVVVVIVVVVFVLAFAAPLVLVTSAIFVAEERRDAEGEAGGVDRRLMVGVAEVS